MSTFVGGLQAIEISFDKAEKTESDSNISQKMGGR